MKIEGHTTGIVAECSTVGELVSFIREAESAIVVEDSFVQLMPTLSVADDLFIERDKTPEAEM